MKSLCSRLLAVALIMCAFSAHTQPTDLPPENVRLRASDLPGYKVAIQKCGICHSADYVAYQPPNMSLTLWTTEMAKMQHAYGAPIDDAQVQELGAYLAANYGDAQGSVAPTGSVSTVDAGIAPDAIGLLKANGCLGCHQIAAKLVGPAYHDVAAKYNGNPAAASTVESSIRKGSVGKWGQIPMPGFANLPDEQVKALATFILAQ